MKTCTKCGVSKGLKEFSKHPKHKDGHRGSCKVCDGAAARVRLKKLSHEKRAERRERGNRSRRARYIPKPPPPPRFCTVEGCSKKHFANGHCNMHYLRVLKHGCPEYVPPPSVDPGCKAPGCSKKHESKGYCSMHYMRIRRHGDPEYKPGPRIPPRPDGLKVCSKCGIPKDSEEFFNDPVRGLKSWCRECSNAHQNERYTMDPERRRKKKEGNVLIKYGLTPEAWNTLFEEQGGVCAICKQPETWMNKRLSVDHDHGTGKVRGLLCNTCNRGVGLLKDSISTLSAAIDYLKKVR